MNKEFILFDTEYTCWEGSMERKWSGNNEFREIIQISALKIDKNLNIIDRFNLMVKPTFNPILSQYCINLTHLNTDDVLNGKSYKDMLRKFEVFNDSGHIKSWSWGNDIHVMIENNTLNNTTQQRVDSFFDLSEVFKLENIDTGNSSSGELASYLGIDVSGHVHNAEFDTLSLFKSVELHKKNILKHLF